MDSVNKVSLIDTTEAKYCLLKPQNKVPIEKAWQDKGYEWGDDRLQDHIAQGGNYGVIAGTDNIRFLDCDTPEFADEMLAKMPRTFSVRTGSGGLHLYFKSEYDTNHVFADGRGEWRAQNAQVVGPNCIHPNGNRYEVLHDDPIARITEAQLKEVVGKYLRSNDPRSPNPSQEDTTRSATEYRYVCSLIAKGKTKEEVFREMQAFAKWAEAPAQYRQLTYNKAASFVGERYNDELKATLDEVKEVLKKWLHITDLEVVDIVFAVSIAERLPGDPVWLFLIAPPGGSKTELLRAFDGPLTYHLSDLTSKTFISGLMVGEGKTKRKVNDLLPQLDGKLLIFKDFTTVLEKQKDERREIISQFREIYDGSYAKKFGSLDKKVEYKACFGLIAGVTPVIDKHWKLMQQLGERFLKLRWSEDDDKATRRAQQNEGKEREMRYEIREVVGRFTKHVEVFEPDFPKELVEPLIVVAKFLALCRTPVAIQSNHSDFYFDFVPTPERPTRLVKQLKKLTKCLAVVREKRVVSENEIQSAIRVALDTCPQDRLDVLKALKKKQHDTLDGCTIDAIKQHVKLPRTSISRICQQLYMIELVQITDVIRKTDSGYREQVKYYKLSENAQALTPPAFLGASKKMVGGTARGGLTWDKRHKCTAKGCDSDKCEYNDMGIPYCEKHYEDLEQ